jgi:lipopolysaccharide/colanic/teichoic acid biosynthesis glycosyltransferase
MYDTSKRIIDFVLAFIAIIVLSPIMFLVAVAIKVDSSGPIFADTPLRVGKNGKLIKVYKFRSMIPNAQKLLMTDPRLKRLFKEYKQNNYKLKDDPRITRMGAFIRKYSIDEFPQFINVLLGNMSLVGPRPYHSDELLEQQKKYPGTEKFVNEMHKVKPGVTGYWQVEGRSDVDFDKRIEMDAYYARKKSLFFDLLIIAKTPWAMISGKGAV